MEDDIANELPQISGFESIFEPSKDVSKEESFNIVTTLCVLIAKYQKIAIDEDYSVDENIEADQAIKDFAEHNKIRVRKIELLDTWWKEDNGALLGYYDNQPCVMLPMKRGGYQIHLDFSRKKITVNDVIAKKISTQACYFYQTFPVALFTLAIPIITGKILGAVVMFSEKTQLYQLVVILTVNLLIVAAFNVNKSIASIRMQLKSDLLLQSGMWDRLLKAPLYFTHQFKTGDLLYRLNLLDIIRELTYQSIFMLFFSSLTMLVTLGLMLFYNVTLSFYVFIMAAVVVVVLLCMSFKSISFGNRAIELESDSYGIMLQIISGILKFRITNSERRAFKFWFKKTEEKLKCLWASGKRKSFITAFAAAAIVLQTLILYIFVHLKLDEMSFSDFIIFNGAFVLFSLAVIEFVEAWQALFELNHRFKMVEDILHEMPEAHSRLVNPGELDGRLELRNVLFYYPHSEEEPIFNNLSLTIESGKSVALVGNSGSGKSTLLRILLGFEKPLSGSVIYNGMDLSMINPTQVRKQIGIVLQNNVLVGGTIFDNIVSGKSDIKRKEVIEFRVMITYLATKVNPLTDKAEALSRIVGLLQMIVPAYGGEELLILKGAISMLQV